MVDHRPIFAVGGAVLVSLFLYFAVLGGSGYRIVVEKLPPSLPGESPPAPAHFAAPEVDAQTQVALASVRLDASDTFAEVVLKHTDMDVAWLLQDDSGASVPSRLGNNDKARESLCRVLYLAGMSLGANGDVYTPAGAPTVLELGAWAGQSSRCIGAGLAAASTEGALYSLDEFRNYDRHRSALRGTAFANYDADPLLPVWQAMMASVYPSAVAVPGDVYAATPAAWDGRPVGVFVTDCATSAAAVRAQLLLASRHLVPGGLLLLLDFMSGKDASAAALVYARLVPAEVLQILYVDPLSPMVVFSVEKQLPIAEIARMPVDGTPMLTPAEWAATASRYERDVDRMLAAQGADQRARDFKKAVIARQVSTS